MVMHRMAFRGFQQYSAYRGSGKILSLLNGHPVMTRKELGERLGISRQRLAELLGRLEETATSPGNPPRATGGRFCSG